MKISYNPFDVCTRTYNLFTIIYDLKNRQILQLEDVSADIWRFLVDKEDTTIDDIAQHIADLYDCPADEITEDIIEFIQNLYDSGIVLLDGKYQEEIENDQNCSLDGNSIIDDVEGQIIGALETENQLYSATVEMTYACNEKCIHCYAHYPTADITSDYLSLA